MPFLFPPVFSFSLIPPISYYYAVGNEGLGILSKEYSFNYNKEATAIKFLSYGDMGVKNSVGAYLKLAAIQPIS